MNTRPGRHAVCIGRHYFGIERSMVRLHGQPYLLRYILYLGPIGLRLHKFFRGDEDRAPHDHPFWFVTMPFSNYWEQVYDDAELAPAVAYPWGLRRWRPRYRLVRAWRFHYRPASFKHIVVERQGPKRGPFWTFVIFGFVQPNWGYWPTPDTFIPWQTWGNNYDPSN